VKATRPVFRLRPSRVRRTSEGGWLVIDEVHDWVHRRTEDAPFRRDWLNAITAATPSRPRNEWSWTR
jgi:hypothetical protein